MTTNSGILDTETLLYDEYIVQMCEYIESFRRHIRESCLWIDDDLSQQAVIDLMEMTDEGSQSKSNYKRARDRLETEKEEELGKAINRSEGVS